MRKPFWQQAVSALAGAGRRGAGLQGDAQGSQGACCCFVAVLSLSLSLSVSNWGERTRARAALRLDARRPAAATLFFLRRQRPPSPFFRLRHVECGVFSRKTLSLPLVARRARFISALSRNGRGTSFWLEPCEIEQNSTPQCPPSPTLFPVFFCLLFLISSRPSPP